MDLLQRAIQ